MVALKSDQRLIQNATHSKNSSGFMDAAKGKFSHQNKFNKVYFKTSEKIWNQDVNQKIEGASGFIIRPRQNTAFQPPYGSKDPASNAQFHTPDPSSPKDFPVIISPSKDSHDNPAPDISNRGASSVLIPHEHAKDKRKGCEVIFYC